MPEDNAAPSPLTFHVVEFTETKTITADSAHTADEQGDDLSPEALDELSRHVENLIVSNGDPNNLRGDALFGEPLRTAQPGVDIGDLMPSPLEQHLRPDPHVLEPNWVPNEQVNEQHAKAYEAGKLAYQQGYAAGSNPHATTPERVRAMGWMAGWMDAMNEAIQATTAPMNPRRRAISV